MILIRREVYIVDNLSVKTLIEIDIIKPEGIILNINKNITIIDFYNLLEILISIVIKDLRTNIVIISKA